jgi:hypothetical protein
MLEQKTQALKVWMSDFLGYLTSAGNTTLRLNTGGQALLQTVPLRRLFGKINSFMWFCVFVAGKDGLRVLWESGLSVFGSARTRNDYVTSHRIQAFARLTESMMREAGADILDIVNVTRSRWEASWDGLHMAARLDGDNWGSQVASMVYQIVLNAVLGDCVT